MFPKQNLVQSSYLYLLTSQGCELVLVVNLEELGISLSANKSDKLGLVICSCFFKVDNLPT